MPHDSTHARTADEASPLLTTYLRDHRAGAAAGLELTKRCQRSNEGSTTGSVLTELERAIDQDRRSLEHLMDVLDVEPSRVKMLLAKAAPLIGRLKLNNRPFGAYSPLTRVQELEALAAGILGKQHLWLALLAVAGTDARLDEGELRRLADRATAQRERVTELHRSAAADAFTAPPAGGAAGGG